MNVTQRKYVSASFSFSCSLYSLGFVNTLNTSLVPSLNNLSKCYSLFKDHCVFHFLQEILFSPPSHSYAMLITLSREHHKFSATLHPVYFISFLMREINLSIFVFPQHLPLCFCITDTLTFFSLFNQWLSNKTGSLE